MLFPVSAATPYSEYERVLRAAHAVTEPAEAHGSLAGALCVVESYAFDDWLSEILPEGELDAGTELALRTLYDDTAEALAAADLQFELLCPDDETPIEARTQALGLWCNGFIYGLGVNGGKDPRQLPGDAGEIVRDLAEIARASVDAADGDEVNESAYAELLEFVRVGAQLVHDELTESRQPPRPRPPASAAVH
jgi:uncharacterized protein YgfB (UPF0149 family)